MNRAGHVVRHPVTTYRLWRIVRRMRSTGYMPKKKGGDGASAKIDAPRDKRTKDALAIIARGVRQGGPHGRMKARMAARIIEQDLHGSN